MLAVMGAKLKDYSSSPSHNISIQEGMVEPMPIIKDEAFGHLTYGGVPQERRDDQFRKWLSVGVKISVQNATGSGTIIYFDRRDGYAYIQSCGHLWGGNMLRSLRARSQESKCRVIVWYQNNVKLAEPKTYNAEVLFYSNNRGRDCSLLRFKPDWIPNYIPIAPPDFQYEPNMQLHSVGCDGGREVAHYDVRYLGTNQKDVVTTENSPRPGRSGGGLMSEDYYVGVCWGTTDMSGEGNGLFTPISVVRELNKQNGFGWLNEAGIVWARQIPIIDRNGPQGTYPPDYIPVPVED